MGDPAAGVKDIEFTGKQAAAGLHVIAGTYAEYVRAVRSAALEQGAEAMIPNFFECIYNQPATLEVVRPAAAVERKNLKTEH